MSCLADGWSVHDITLCVFHYCCEWLSTLIIILLYSSLSSCSQYSWLSRRLDLASTRSHVTEEILSDRLSRSQPLFLEVNSAFLRTSKCYKIAAVSTEFHSPIFLVTTAFTTRCYYYMGRGRRDYLTRLQGSLWVLVSAFACGIFLQGYHLLSLVLN